jgi:glutamate racemase
VENGRIHPGDVVIETVAREYLSPLKEAGLDTLILGCTHYSLLEEIIAGIMGPEVTLVSAGEESAYQLRRILREQDLLAENTAPGVTEFCVSDRVEDFERIASLFLQEDLRHEARRIDIEQY